MATIDFKIQENGSLKITADEEARLDLQDAHDDGGYPKAYGIIIEAARENGFEFIQPEWIGALTDSPIFGKDVEFPEEGSPKVNGQVWWFPNYAVIDEVDKLIKNGEITFTSGS